MKTKMKNLAAERAFVKEVLSFYVIYLKVWMQATAKKVSRTLPLSFKTDASPVLINAPRIHSTFSLGRA